MTVSAFQWPNQSKLGWEKGKGVNFTIRVHQPTYLNIGVVLTQQILGTTSDTSLC